MDTKEKILKAALHLFNTEGTEKVTTRHIASSLEMSQGNLHYHYPNKDKLILALYEQFKTETINAQQFKNGDFTLQQMLHSKIINFEIMYTYRFLFLDRDIIWRRLPIVKDETIRLIKKKRMQLSQIIEIFKSQDIFRKEIKEAQIESFLNNYVIIVNSWLDSIPLLAIEGDISTYFAKQTFHSWLSYLTPKGEHEFERSLKSIKH